MNQVYRLQMRAATIVGDETLATTPIILLSSVLEAVSDETLRNLHISYTAAKPVRYRELYKHMLKALGKQTKATEIKVQNTEHADVLRLSARVLLTEDNPVNQELAKAMLTKFGCSVEIAENGIEALEKITANKSTFDIILMDCQMPHMDGFTATQKIRAWENDHMDNKRISIIALTANALSGDKDKCLAAGMDDYLSKPFNTKQLAAMLKQWLAADKPSVKNEGMINNASPTTTFTDAASAILNRESLNAIRALQDPDEPDFLTVVIQTYIESAHTLVHDMEHALQSNDAGKLRIAAHTLKSASWNVGADKLGELCKELERLGDAAELDSAGVVLLTAQSEYVAVRYALDAEINRQATA